MNQETRKVCSKVTSPRYKVVCEELPFYAVVFAEMPTNKKVKRKY